MKCPICRDRGFILKAEMSKLDFRDLVKGITPDNPKPFPIIEVPCPKCRPPA